jgi:hypothetical protein
MASFFKIETIEFTAGDEVQDCIRALVEYACSLPEGTIVRAGLNGFKCESASGPLSEEELEAEVKSLYEEYLRDIEAHKK